MRRDNDNLYSEKFSMIIAAPLNTAKYQKRKKKDEVKIN